jgi:uncharacterized membrane protein YoaK (UPF0700 family)
MTALIVAALFIGSSTIWFGHESIWVAAVSILGAAVLVFLRFREKTRIAEKLATQSTWRPAE